MGVAAWNRGTAVIRRQHDAQADEQRPGIEARYTRERIRELELQILEMQKEHERQLNRARLCLTQTREREEQLRQERNALRYSLSLATEALTRFRKSWHKASAVLRTALTPTQYAEAREDAQKLYPHVFT